MSKGEEGSRYTSPDTRKFSISIDIDAPVERVWSVMSDIDRWHEWTPSVTSVKRMRDGPFAVGSRVVIRQPGFPPAIWKLTAIEPGQSFMWISTAPGLRVVARHSVQATKGGSRATLLLDLQGIVGGLFGRLTRNVNEKYLGYEAKGLKARSENPLYTRKAGR